MKIIKGEPGNQHKPIAIVVSRFNQDITSALLNSALEQLHTLQVEDELITVVHVPGAVEIGIAALRLAKTDNYSAIIVFGAVIKGDTAHFDYVSDCCSQSCQQISLQENIPVIYGVLNTFTHQQALDRTNGTVGNMGKEAVDAAMEMLDVCEQIDV